MSKHPRLFATTIAVISFVVLVSLLQAKVSSGAVNLKNIGLDTTYNLTGANIKAPGINGYNLSTAYVGNGAQVTFTYGWSSDFYTVSAAPKLVLQRKSEDGWETTTGKVEFTHGKSILATTPVYKSSKKSVSVQYRLASLAYSGNPIGVANTSYSKILTVVYENQQKYTGLAKSIYSDMKAYCPQAAVHTKNIATNGEAGFYQQGGFYIQITPLVSSLNADEQKFIALHECAHEREFINYGSTFLGWKAMTAAVGKTFTIGARSSSGKSIDPIEHAADCAAESILPGTPLSYGGSCSSLELLEAHRLLDGLRL